jgi:hypothetical protein
MKLWIVPIEPLEERYSTQWIKWFDEDTDFLGVQKEFVFGEALTSSIETGQFLDVFGTNYYKASQMQKLVALLYSKKIADDDAILFLDAWFPGIESLFYIRDGADLKFKIYGCLHAGTWDEHDFLYRKGMRRWAGQIETNWIEELDGVFVATQFHKDLITRKQDVSPRKIYVTGFPLRMTEMTFGSWALKDNVVVFPHRIAPEKQPTIFTKIQWELGAVYPHWKFLKTKEVTFSKDSYYDLLSKSKIAVSCALQETWGIAQQEALFSGCLPLVPDRLSYTEMYPDCFRYKAEAECIVKLSQMIEACDKYGSELHALVSARNGCMERLNDKNAQSIKSMMQIIGALHGN